MELNRRGAAPDQPSNHQVFTGLSIQGPAVGLSWTSNHLEGWQRPAALTRHSRDEQA